MVTFGLSPRAGRLYTMSMSTPRHRNLLLLAAALLGAACGKDSTGPQPRLALSPASRMLSIRDDSSLVSADSAVVAISGADASTAPWVATHTDSATWVTLGTSAGTGPGVVRWTRNAAGLYPGTYVDTITVTLRTADGATVRLVDTLEVRSAPSQFITVRRAWRPGERDSLIAAIVLRRAWNFPLVGDISDLAPAALAAWDSTTDVIVNPLWRPAAAPFGQLAALYDATFSAVGMDLWIVFDAYPDSAGIQRDSLTWKMILWYKPAEETWKGYAVAATTANTWNPYRTIKTTEFDAAAGKSGQASGEARFSTGTYWEGNNGGYRLTFNGGYGAFSVIGSGPFLGGDVAFGLMSADLKNNNMPRILGTDPPATQLWTANWTNINAQKIRCYFTPLTPPVGFHSCTGAAYADIVAAAQARRVAALAAQRRPVR